MNIRALSIVMATSLLANCILAQEPEPEAEPVELTVRYIQLRSEYFERMGVDLFSEGALVALSDIESYFLFQYNPGSKRKPFSFQRLRLDPGQWKQCEIKIVDDRVSEGQRVVGVQGSVGSIRANPFNASPVPQRQFLCLRAIQVTGQQIVHLDLCENGRKRSGDIPFRGTAIIPLATSSNLEFTTYAFVSHVQK